MDVGIQRAAGYSVTVAVCTWNRAALLDATLHSLRAVVVPEDVVWELIVVDNNSTDNTPAIIERHVAHLPLRYIRETNQGLSYARNTALVEARANYILFTDDDVIVDAHWIEAALATWKRFPQAVVVGGRIEPWFPEPLDQSMAETFPLLAQGYCGLDYGDVEEALPPGRDVYGANLALRRDGLQGAAFNTKFGPVAGRAINGDEIDLIRQVRSAGGVVVWSPGMRVKHYVEPRRMTLEYVTQFYFDYARHNVRLHGIPGRARISGVPLWLWKQVLITGAKWRLTRLGRATQLASLNALRDYTVSRGMFIEARHGTERN